jgi:hypothetical protein
MAKLYTIEFIIDFCEGKQFSNISSGWLLKDNNDHLLITTAHGICLDKEIDYKINVNHKNEKIELIGYIFKRPLFTNIIIMKIKNLSPELFIELTFDNNSLDFFQLSRISKNLYKKNKNKLYLTAYNRLIEIEITSTKITSLGKLPFAPKNIILVGKINEKIGLKGYTGSPIISLNQSNDFTSRKIIGVLNQHNPNNNEITIIPSYYICKSLLLDENIIQGIELPFKFDKKWIFQKNIKDIEKNDILTKIDGYKLYNNGFIYDPTFGIKVPFDAFFLTKENKILNVEVKRNNFIRNFTLELSDINNLLPIKIENQTFFVKNKRKIDFHINSGNFIFLKKAFKLNQKILDKIFSNEYTKISVSENNIEFI